MSSNTKLRMLKKMQTQRIKPLGCYLFLTLIFSAVSLCGRNALIFLFNSKNFGFFSIDFMMNNGAAFSLLQGKTSLLITVSFLILFTIILYIYKNILNFSKLEILYSSMLSAGIICNLMERMINGFVIDYIKLNFMAFPVFNISDVFINIGAFLLICNILFNDDK